MEEIKMHNRRLIIEHSECPHCVDFVTYLDACERSRIPIDQDRIDEAIEAWKDNFGSTNVVRLDVN
jgi:hypothetical protein